MITASGPSSPQSAKRTLAPAPGVTPPPTDGASYRFLSDVIIARGLVRPAAMKAALQASLAGRSLTEILVDNGALGEDDLARTLAEHHRLDFIDLDVFAVDARAAALVEPDVARRFGAVPIALLESGAVVVALYDPNGSTAVLEFAGLTGRTIQPAVASRRQIEALIAALRHGGALRAAAPAPMPRQPAAVVAPSAEPRLRSVRAPDVWSSARIGPDDAVRSPPLASAPSPRAEERPAAPAPATVSEPQPAVVEEPYGAPSAGPTIDIVGEPGVPYVPALAPMASSDPPAHKAPKIGPAKAHRLRRLIRAITRSA